MRNAHLGDRVDHRVTIARALAPASSAVEHVLADVRWRVLDARQHQLPQRTAVRSSQAEATLVYVRAGRVRTVHTGVDDPSIADHDELASGDLRLACGGDFAVHAIDDAIVVVASVELVGGPLPGVLPQALTVRGFDDAEPAIAALAADLGCPIESRRRDRPSDGIICAHIATTILAAAVRSWAESGCAPEDWPARASDPFIGRVLDAIHAEPGRAWSLVDLASLGAMSRSAFAERFRTVVGTTPLRYLSQVRIAAAKRHLADDGLTVSETSRMLGYASEEGFSRAFRRHVGALPSTWRTQQRQPAGV